MQENTIELNQLVLAGLDPLKPERREEVLAEIFKLIEDRANWRPVSGTTPSQRLHAVNTTGGLRAYFRVDEVGRVLELEDLWRPSTWQGQKLDSSTSLVAE